MKPVDQEKFAKKCEGCGDFHVRGDCASAVIASIMELPLSEVPFFVNAGVAWWQWIEEWLDQRGWVIRQCERANLPDKPVYVAGLSPRGFHHACVWDGGPDGMIVHDPHHTRAGLVGDPLWFAVIEPAPRRCNQCGRGISNS